MLKPNNRNESNPNKTIVMKTSLLLAVTFVAATGFNISNAFAQQKEENKIIVKAAKVDVNRVENPNIEQYRPETDIEVPKPEKPRKEACNIGFDNNTGYTVDVFIDGKYEITMPPWEFERMVYLYSDYTRIYCITAGQTLEWKASGNCNELYYYKLEL